MEKKHKNNHILVPLCEKQISLRIYTMKDFNSSVIEPRLDKAIVLAQEHMRLSTKEIKLINHLLKITTIRKWNCLVKERTFDITTGSVDGAIYFSSFIGKHILLILNYF